MPEFKTFKNQRLIRPVLSSPEGQSGLFTVCFREDVAGFRFQSVIARSANSNIALVHGVTVDPRHVWQAIFGFHTEPSKAVKSTGREVWCGMITERVQGEADVRRWEIRLGADAKTGPVVATLTKQERWED